MALLARHGTDVDPGDICFHLAITARKLGSMSGGDQINRLAENAHAVATAFASSPVPFISKLASAVAANPSPGGYGKILASCDNPPSVLSAESLLQCRFLRLRCLERIPEYSGMAVLAGLSEILSDPAVPGQTSDALIALLKADTSRIEAAAYGPAGSDDRVMLCRR